MPPQFPSRHLYSLTLVRSDGYSLLSNREPFRFLPLTDTIVHVVAGGDTLFNIAGRYYKGFPRPAGLWWIIADFQPDPIIDPTIALGESSTIFVPSVRTVVERILSDTRLQEATA